MNLKKVIVMGHVVVKYKVTMDQPEDEAPDYDAIANKIDNLPEVQTVEIKPLAFGMMFVEVQAVLGEGDGIVDSFEEKIRSIDSLIGQVETLEMGRL
ncbi:MAG: translation elongation factor EF-1beta [Candidatus Thalassarchaeaceae archaeon]